MIFTDHSAPNPNAELARRSATRAGLLLSPNTTVGSELFVSESAKTTLRKLPKLQDVYGAFIALSEADVVSRKNGLEIFSDPTDQRATVRAMSQNTGLLITGVSGDVAMTNDPIYGDFLRAFSDECQALDRHITEKGKREDVVGDLMDMFKRGVRATIIGAENFNFNRLNINEIISTGTPMGGEFGGMEYAIYFGKLKALVSGDSH